MPETRTSRSGQQGRVRVPTQARAKRTVTAILDATADLLVGGGMAAVNTNAVATAAGVNVATVYSYFPDKIAIVRRLAQEFEDRRFAYVAGMVEHLGEPDWQRWFSVVIDELARFRFDVRGAVEIRKAVMGDAELRDIDDESTAAAAELVIDGLRAHNSALTVEHARVVSGVVVRTITELVDSAFASDPPDLRIIEELKLLVVRYLTPYLEP